MTSPPDLSSLSLNSHPQQRLHDSYDYEGSPARQQYFATTSPGNIAAQSQFSALTMGQSPLKAKPARGALPTVRFCDQNGFQFAWLMLPPAMARQFAG